MFTATRTNDENWAKTNGFKFSVTKTVCMHFSLGRSLDQPSLMLSGNNIPVVEQFQLLGLVFDRKLSFVPHMKQLKEKCQKVLKLLRVVASQH